MTTGSTLVDGGKRGGMKAVHGRAIRRLKRKMHMRWPGGRHRVRADEDLVGPEIALAFAFDLSTERTERRDVEALRRFHVTRDQVHVVEQPAAMQLLRFHDG